ncbi:hypothetical protein EDB81DRAFT_230996 [Dactylonectria macrodidyma]|uniref:Uncharacterized protein n=1 Tax=Dactylonectria macrodidyma TaxID=307937 RepID=A0A9P9IIB7_9HYPO|nr:hypothetical protein EDB81DRAFT_230996 [Dactylonectria macrodidyma]
MDLDTEVEEMQQELSSLKTRLKAFEAASKAKIDADHRTMLAALQKSVDAVESTALYLNTGTSSIAGYLEYKTSLNKRTATKALVQKHLTDMDSKFTVLQTAASSGLERVETIKKACDEMDCELEAIRAKLEALTTRTWSALTVAKKTLVDKQKQAAEAKVSLTSTQSELSALETKMTEEKDTRDVMRVARVASWGLGLLFPPMLLVAGGLEGAAIGLREDRRKLQTQIDAASTRHSSLASEVSTIERQTAALDKVVTEARSLWRRSDTIDTDSQAMKTLICERLDEYQTMKTSTDGFRAWSRDLQTKTGTAQLLGSSSEVMLRRTTTQIVDKLLETEQGDAKAICAKLKKLELRS